MSHENMHENESMEISEKEINFSVEGNRIHGEVIIGERPTFQLVEGVEIFEEGSLDRVLVVEDADNIPNVSILDKDGDFYDCWGDSQHIKVGEVEIMLNPWGEQTPRITGPSIEEIKNVLKIVDFRYVDPGDI